MALHEEIARIVAEALGEENVPADTPLVELVTSLSAMKVVARVRYEVKRKISQRDVFQASSLADLVRCVEVAPVVEDAPRRRIPRLGGTTETGQEAD